MESEDTFTSPFSYISAFALGGIAGAAVALLYAPRRGDETRQIVRDRIRRGGEVGREKLREGAELTREKLQQGAEYGRQVARKVVGKGQEIAEQAGDFAAAQAEDVASFGERRRKPRSLSPEMPEPV
jgi:gas vesicle protein